MTLMMLQPLEVFASGGSIVFDSNLLNSIGLSTKTLDLRNSGLRISLTEAEKQQLKDQAAEEYDYEVNHTVGKVNELVEAYDKENSEFSLKNEDGSYNSNWNTGWKEIISNNSMLSHAQEIYSEWNEKDYGYQYKSDQSKVIKQLDSLYSDSGDKCSDSIYRTYLRLKLCKYIAHGDAESPLSDDIDEIIEEEIKERGIPVEKYAGVWVLPGSIGWYKGVYDVFNYQTGNEEFTAIAKRIKQHYIDARYLELLNQTLTNKIGENLEGVSFDFDLVEVPSEEKHAFQIGKKVNGNTIEAGKFKSDSEGKVTSRIHFSTVDFGGKQYFDPFLCDAVNKIKLFPSPDAYKQLMTIRDYELLDHLLLYDGGSLESKSFPYVHKAGWMTKNENAIWPYLSMTRGGQDTSWHVESLARYSILKAEPNSDGSKPTTYQGWSFGEEIPLTGTNIVPVTGFNLYYPQFDDSGNLVSISKPLMNSLVDPEVWNKVRNIDNKDDAVSDNYAYGFNKSNVIEKLDIQDANNETSANKVYRYKLVENTDKSVTINGHKVKPSDDYKIVDYHPAETKSYEYGTVITKEGYFCIYDSAEDAAKNYDAIITEDLENGIHGIYADMLGSTADFKNEVIPDKPNVPDKPDTPHEVIPQTPRASLKIQKHLDGWKADTSLVQQGDLTQYGYTLTAADDIRDNDVVKNKAGDKIYEKKCDALGQITFDNLFPGKYTLTETSKPGGTESEAKSYVIEVEKVSDSKAIIKVNGKVIDDSQFYTVNNSITKTEIKKVDENNDFLEGAELELIDQENNKVVDSWTSTDASHRIAGLKLNHSYTLHEKSAPEGYEKAKDISLSVENTDVKVITMRDRKTSIKGDKDKGDKINENHEEHRSRNKVKVTKKHKHKTIVNRIKSVIPRTGDEQNIVIWIVVLTGATAGIGMVIKLRRRQ